MSCGEPAAPGAGAGAVDRREAAGPFDLIGDVHACADELGALLALLGYVEVDGAPTHPHGRTAVFVGDLVGRGPRMLSVVETVRAMFRRGAALAVSGNHDERLAHELLGPNPAPTPTGLDAELAGLDPSERGRVRRDIGSFLAGLPGHLVLDGGRLVVAHAGLPADLHGDGSDAARRRAVRGATTGERDGAGRPVRVDWVAQYRAEAVVVFGHTPVVDVVWRNGTLNIDTGCVYGGRLTALRWPEREVVSVPAARIYAVRGRVAGC